MLSLQIFEWKEEPSITRLAFTVDTRNVNWNKGLDTLSFDKAP